MPQPKTIAAFLLNCIMLFLLMIVWFPSVVAQSAPDTLIFRSADEQMSSTSADTLYRYFPQHSPVKATWMSAALPGLGQYYNQKYWKIPAVYVGFGVLGYFIASNKKEYDAYRLAYAESYMLGEQAQYSDNLLVKNYSSEQLLSQREYYQSNLELSYILTVAWYIVQIVDAVVDAHLYSFDVSDDLSLQLKPQVMPMHSNIVSSELTLAPILQLRWQLPFGKDRK